MPEKNGWMDLPFEAVWGYYTDPRQQREEPMADPGLAAPCPICRTTLGSPERVRTIAVMPLGASRSYFYRVHRDCHERLSAAEQQGLEDDLMTLLPEIRSTGGA